jgi:hypothetical protein
MVVGGYVGGESGKDNKPRHWRLCLSNLWHFRVQEFHDRNASQVISISLAGVGCLNFYLNLTTLAPDIVAAILDETLPPEVTLFELAAGTPVGWEEQQGSVERR